MSRDDDFKVSTEQGVKGKLNPVLPTTARTILSVKGLDGLAAGKNMQATQP